MRAIRRSLPTSIVMLACAVCVASPSSARAGTLELIDALRTRDCTDPLSSAQSLHASAGLDAAARELMKGGDLRDALKRAEFHAARSAVIRIRGDVDDASLVRMLGKGHCGTITDAELTAIGVARDENEVTILLATPVASLASTDADRVAGEVLQRVNAARASPRRCGDQRFSTAPPVVLNDKLAAAALIQANDMAERGHLSHRGADDSRPAERVARLGYAWKAVGENVAAGQYTAKDVVDGWLSSPNHCAIVMDPEFTDMGVAYVTNASQDMGIYWAQVFGRPRSIDL